MATSFCCIWMLTAKGREVHTPGSSGPPVMWRSASPFIAVNLSNLAIRFLLAELVGPLDPNISAEVSIFL